MNKKIQKVKEVKKIRIIGDAKVHDDKNNIIINPLILKQLTFVDHNENFSDYFREERMKELFSGGKMTFELQDVKLYTVTTYNIKSLEIITQDILDLIDYTSGQWSDGIGEGLEQFPVMYEDGIEYYISASHKNQKITFEPVYE